MKNSIITLIIIACLASCTPAENYKTIRQEVLTDHDQVMMDSEMAFKNKMKLDTLASGLDSLKKLYADLDTLKEKEQIEKLRKQLDHADDQMNNWMHQFDAEIGQKSNETAIAYFKGEKKKVGGLDSLFKQVIKESDDYLKRFKK
ncbi:MAG TPA: hypothetical protein DIT07_12185 [Sphingobacteriaceae bacterium]|nr:hypothetical protein [Sphingobacteriaceae bacterium]